MPDRTIFYCFALVVISLFRLMPKSSEKEITKLRVTSMKNRKETDFLNSPTQLERRKILKENCPAYLTDNNLTQVEGHNLSTVTAAITKDRATMYRTLRYFPRLNALYHR